MPRLASGAFIVSRCKRKSLSEEAPALADASYVRLFWAPIAGIVAIDSIAILY